MPSTVPEVAADTQKEEDIPLLPLPHVWGATWHHFYYFKKEYSSSQRDIRFFFLINLQLFTVKNLPLY